jgi:hypothetical protein
VFCPTDADVDNDDDDHDDDRAIYFFSCQGYQLLPTIVLHKHALVIIIRNSFYFIFSISKLWSVQLIIIIASNHNTKFLCVRRQALF